MSRAIEMTGKVCGRLTVIERVENKGKRALWLCKCECGETTITTGVDLRNGNTASCGCLRGISSIKHGQSKKGEKSSEYTIWANIIQRCANPNNRQYQDYGGRGITVCDEWLDSFEQFYKDMDKRPSKNHSIDRIDNDKGYSPDNCKWATATEQARNQRTPKNNTTGISGVYQRKDSNSYVASIRADGKRIHLGTFTNLEDATQARKEAEEKYWHKSA